MLRRTEGIVLRTRPFGEADLIIDYLTRDIGVQSAFAKSPRKIKSRFGASLEPLTHSTVSFMGKEDARLPRLTQSDILRPFSQIREDLDAFLTASEFAELALKLLPEKEPNQKAFELLLWALEQVAGGAGGLLPVIFRIRLLALSGYAPALKGCVKCGGEAARFYLADGALLCNNCKKEGRSIEPSPALLKVYNDFSTWPLHKVMRIKPSGGLLMELKGLMELHIKEHIALRIRSREGFGRAG